MLRQAVELGASDLLMTAGHPVMVTVAGGLQQRYYRVAAIPASGSGRT